MKIRYEIPKDKKLRDERAISFEDVKDIIASWNFFISPNLKPWREHQKIIVFLYKNYPHCCPFVIEEDWGFFLKTIYPAREYRPLFDNLNEKNG